RHQPRRLLRDRRPQDRGALRRLLPHPRVPRGDVGELGRVALQLRLQPRRLLPAHRRPPRLHFQHRGPRQAGAVGPEGGESHAAAAPGAAAGDGERAGHDLARRRDEDVRQRSRGDPPPRAEVRLPRRGACHRPRLRRARPRRPGAVRRIAGERGAGDGARLRPRPRPVAKDAFAALHWCMGDITSGVDSSSVITPSAAHCLAQVAEVTQPLGSAIYFAVDYNATIGDIEGAVTEYFKVIDAALRPKFLPGVYGSGATCAAMLAAGLADFAWLSQSVAFLGTPG